MKKIVVLPGDGIGVEVTRAALMVLRAVSERFALSVDIKELLIGGASLDTYGVPIEEEVLSACKNADAVFLGAVGGPRWDHLPPDNRPESALLRLRKELGLFTNLRPVKIYDDLVHVSSIKSDLLRHVDILIVRELTGGIYFGEPKFIDRQNGTERAVDTLEYRNWEIERIARVAFEAARYRRKKVTSVDKANVLVTSQLWRRTVEQVAQDYPEVELEHVLVDNCAMQLMRNPQQFDVILTENMFGDILSDEAAMLAGSLGMLPSASLGESTGLYEPVHGSAPDIAGKNIANPLGAIASVAMMFRYTFKMEEAAQLIERSIQTVLESGFRCADIYSKGKRKVGTMEMAELIISEMELFFLPYI
ncbi:MAG: 3-isopropylmalate dehydrogenase [Calditrichaeota bacterium]|nr:MAG: 3-isopropylmalate dehydrogenase [Calditrichota bacterium]